MPVTLRHRPDGVDIGLLGDVDHSAAASVIASLRAAATGQHVAIDIFDAETLPSDLLIAMADTLARDVSLTVRPYRLPLTGQLSRLGLPARVAPCPVGPHRSIQVDALALVGSANSLRAIQTLIARLPVSQTSLFVVQHVAEDRANLLDELLRQKTDYRVLMPHHLMPIEPGTLYVAPPGHHMKVAHGQIYLTADRKQRFARPSIDELLFSLAEEYGAGAWAMVLCGYGDDGVAGCAALRAKGGTVLTLADDVCADARMLPDHVRQSGASDHHVDLSACLSLGAAALSGLTPASLDLMVEALWLNTGIDVRSHRQGALERRVGALMRSLGCEDLADFQRAIFSSSTARNFVAAQITVGVSGFFRHPTQFQALRRDILPYLSSFPTIKLWSAGCAAGEEAYSLAILLDELGLAPRARLYATDVNECLLDQAARGLYPVSILSPGEANYAECEGQGGLERFFQRHGGLLAISDRLRRLVAFFHHGLTSLGVFNQFELILCRNVLIYLNQQSQRDVLTLFSQSLHPDGFLVLGPNDGLDQIAREQGFVPYGDSPGIYRKQADCDHE